MRQKLRAGVRLAIVAAAAYVLAPAAAAGDCDAGACGPRVSNGYGHRADCTAGHFGQKIYPLFETRYIKQFCGPTASPNSCFGYFKPQITPWGQACPLYADPAGAVAYGPTAAPPLTIPPAATTPAAPAPRPADIGPLPTIPTVPAPPADLPKPPSAPRLPSNLEPSARLPVGEAVDDAVWVPVSASVKK